MMQHQYWVTKKSVLRKLGGKEDDCIISSDAELDAKLELFKSINESCLHLQRVIDLYQERLCYLAQEENALGRYLKECGKNEKNVNAGQIMLTAGKALAYTGHQRLTIRPPLIRLHHEVETFRGRAISDTKVTVLEMEKVRTEYRAALSWMKSASTQLDPDTGHGLERFRKAQSYVKSSKSKFDRFTLACLQKVDLLAAARCNMFSHALVPYQNSVSNFSIKASETLSIAAAKLENVEPYDFNVVTELAASSNPSDDKDKNLFFNSEYSDKEEGGVKKNRENETPVTTEHSKNETDITDSLLGEDFSHSTDEPQLLSDNTTNTLLDLNWTSTNSSDFLNGDFMPSKLLQEANFNLIDTELNKIENDDTKSKKNNNSKKLEENGGGALVSWLSLFAELDPLANPQQIESNSNDRA